MHSQQSPSQAQVEWSLRGILRRIAAGTVKPRPGLGELVAVYHSAPQSETNRYVGEEYGIEQLYGFFYSYDDLEERPSEVSFEGQLARAPYRLLMPRSFESPKSGSMRGAPNEEL